HLHLAAPFVILPSANCDGYFENPLFLARLKKERRIQVKHRFSVDLDNHVLLKDGKPFQYVSGSLHYFRIPSIYWLDRLLKAKSAGLDAIQMFVSFT
ncbi:unnamed protein product, partial [Protopolystoma xenopodis]